MRSDTSPSRPCQCQGGASSPGPETNEREVKPYPVVTGPLGSVLSAPSFWLQFVLGFLASADRQFSYWDEESGPAVRHKRRPCRFWMDY